MYAHFGVYNTVPFFAKQELSSSEEDTFWGVVSICFSLLSIDPITCTFDCLILAAWKFHIELACMYQYIEELILMIGKVSEITSHSLSQNPSVTTVMPLLVPRYGHS